MRHVYLPVGIGVGILLGIALAATTNMTSILQDIGAYLHVAESTSPAPQGHGHDSHTHVEHHQAGDVEGAAETKNGNVHSHEKDGGEEEGVVPMDAEQIGAANIEIKPAAPGAIRNRLRVPGTIIPDRNRVARVPSKVVGTVAELKKRLGDPVSPGEVIAILDSREVADAKSEYIAAIVNFRLQDTLYQRHRLEANLTLADLSSGAGLSSDPGNACNAWFLWLLIRSALPPVGCAIRIRCLL